MQTGQFIKELRLKKGMTQEDLAAKTDISARTIQRIENADVEARAYTLQNIATALDIDFEVLNSLNNPGLENPAVDNDRLWLPLLHISGLFILLLPPLIIWLMKKTSVKNMEEHGVAVLNFQLSMLLYEIVGSIPFIIFFQLPLLVIVVLFGIAMVLVNTLKVLNGQPYKYPLSINILKPNHKLCR